MSLAVFAPSGVSQVHVTPSHDTPIADKILGRHYTRFFVFRGVKKPDVEKQYSILQ
jgi:hypothetical protein